MSEFDDNKVEYKDAKRGTYIIVPLKYNNKLNFVDFTIKDSIEYNFKSDDMSTLLIKKCKKDSGFVRRFMLDNKIKKVTFDDDIVFPIEEMQVFVFNNGIAFLTLLLIYNNAQTQYIYELINPGYVINRKDNLQKEILSCVKGICINEYGTIFDLYADSDELIVKESYIFNVAIVNKRFKQLETLEKTTFNVHKIIDLSKDFTDLSENDIAYTYGARDIEKCTYRWGACISSQSISYVYAVEKGNKTVSDVIATSKDDLLLTMLVLHQKNTCILLNEKIYNAIIKNKYKNSLKSILKLKKEALEFRSAGTLAPSQVSRWNNVCETYRHLLIVNGVNEALTEIEQKIDLIKDENDRITSQIQNYIATVIAVFGLISIVASVLSIVDMVERGSTNVFVALWISCIGVVIFAFLWLAIKIRKK